MPAQMNHEVLRGHKISDPSKTEVAACRAIARPVSLLLARMKASSLIAMTLISLFLSNHGWVMAEDVPESKVLDIRDPGSDLANFPNSAFTLPQGGFYLETAPASYTGSSSTLSAQYNWEYLLRYGLTDQIEARLYTQGFTVQESPNAAVGFTPLTFDTKIHLWDTMEDYYFPAAGLEIMLQTNLLGSPAFNAGLEPSFSFNFDQDLPYGIQVEYNLGAARFENPEDISKSVWDFTFSWAFQKEIVEDISLFLNGYTNAANLPRIGRLSDKSISTCPIVSRVCRADEIIKKTSALGGNDSQHMIGVGGLWTLDDHMTLFTNLAGGITQKTPDFMVYTGFAWMP